jgi:hypothetical protein
VFRKDEDFSNVSQILERESDDSLENEVETVYIDPYTALIGIHAQGLYSVECLFQIIDLGLYKRVGA